jgi:hypothetical protein
MQTSALDARVDAIISVIKEGGPESRVRGAIFDLINGIKENTQAEIIERLRTEYGLKRPIRHW